MAVSTSPGPWQFDGYRWVRAADGDEVSTVNNEADGPLIAAAPGMLALLRRFQAIDATTSDADVDALDRDNDALLARLPQEKP